MINKLKVSPHNSPHKDSYQYNGEIFDNQSVINKSVHTKKLLCESLGLIFAHLISLSSFLLSQTLPLN